MWSEVVVSCRDLVSETRSQGSGFVQQMTGTPSVLKIMPVVGS